VLDAAQPLKVRTMMLYSGAGAVELDAGERSCCTGRINGVAGKSLYSSENRPQHPMTAPINLGWSDQLAGLGLQRLT